MFFSRSRPANLSVALAANIIEHGGHIGFLCLQSYCREDKLNLAIAFVKKVAYTF